MATAGGPDIVEDGLVLALDAANVKSFKGEPTTNYAPSSFGDWGTESTAERIATGNTFRGQPTYNCRTVVGESYRGIEKTITGLRTAAGSGGTVTMSCYIRNNNNTSYNCYAYIGHDFSSTRAIAANSDWQRIQWTVNESSMNNDYVEFRPYTNNASIYLEMTMPQVEVNVGTATRFTTGTRGTTVANGGGWADISGNSNHGEILNGTSTSNDNTVLGALDFDGTNDYVDVGSITGDFSNFTVIIWFYPTSVSNYENPIDCNYSYNGNTGNIGPRLEMNSSGTLTWVYSNVTDSNGSYYYHSVVNSGLSANTWHCSAITFDGSNSTTYLNGSSSGLSRITNGTPTGFIGSFTNVNLGRGFHLGGAERVYTGRISQTQIFNRALSASEVLQNYNATKGRFGL